MQAQRLQSVNWNVQTCPQVPDMTNIDSANQLHVNHPGAMADDTLMSNGLSRYHQP